MNRFELAPSTAWSASRIVALVMAGAWVLTRSDERGPGRSASARCSAPSMLYLVGFAHGLGFVPGLLTASPFAAVGLAPRVARADVRLPRRSRCVALPMVWFAQYSGGAGPQWGGRYTLLSGALLAGGGAPSCSRVTATRSSASCWWPRS